MWADSSSTNWHLCFGFWTQSLMECVDGSAGASNAATHMGII